jgi:Tfp pilus assembly protein PilF
VAFHRHDYEAAADALSLASAADPFIACLLAQTYEALGDRSQAFVQYRRAASTTAHSVPAAYAQPFAKRKLASWDGGGR